MRKLTLTCMLLCAGYLGVRAQQVVVTATGGTTGPTNYTNFSTAFAAINNGTHTGAVTVTVTADFSESVTPVINASGSGAASYTAITIRPAAGANPVITSTADNTAIIKLNGADNVTVDGSNNGSESRNLTFQNSNTSGSGLACHIWLASTGTDGATGNTIKNCRLMGSNSSGAAYFGVGVYSSTTTLTGYWVATAATTAANSNNIIRNNLFNAANAAVVFKGGTVGETGNQVINNQIGDVSSATNRKFTNAGIHMQNQANCTIEGNTITWFATVNSNVTPGGISIGPGCTGGTIRKNNITGLRFASLSSAAGGIVLYTGAAASGMSIYNNFISDIASDGNTGTPANNAWGIALISGSDYNISFNSVHMNTAPTTTANGYQAALYISATAAAQIRNNILVQSGTNTTNKFSVYAVNANPAGCTINYNDYAAGGTSLAYAGSALAALTNVHSTLQNNLNNSKAVAPVFASATDLHLQAVAINQANLQGAGTNIAGITSDYDGTPRPVPPTIGAHELAPCTPPASPTAAGVSRCGAGTLTLNATAPSGVTFNWYDAATGGTLLGSGNTYTTPSISTTTQYWVLSAVGGCESPRVAVTATVNTLPSVNLGPDTIMCQGSTYTLQAGNPGAAYLWDNAATSQSRSVTTSGTYWVRVTNGAGCVRRDTAQVTFIAPPAVNLGSDREGCQGDTITLNAGSAATAYLWDNNSTQQTRAVTVSGTYFVTASNVAANCKASDTIQVTIHANPIVDLGDDTTICHGTILNLDAGNPGAAYLWDNGATTRTRGIASTGSYNVTVTDAHSCTASDHIFVQVKDLPSGTINAVHGDTANYTFYVLNAQYVTDYTWNFGDGSGPLNGPVVQHRYERNGIYTVTVAFRGECGDNTGDTATVDVFGAAGGTGVGGRTANAGFRVYPNPAAGTLHIENDNGRPIRRLTLINILGQVVSDTDPAGQSRYAINTGSLAAGIYSLRIATDQGFVVQKIAVKH